MNSTIDWTGQLEAYHEDGRTYPAKLNFNDGTVEMPWNVSFGDRANMWVETNGKVPLTGWRIRNSPQAPTEAPQATPPILPSTEQLDRFEALLVRLEGILGGIGKGEVK